MKCRDAICGQVKAYVGREVMTHDKKRDTEQQPQRDRERKHEDTQRPPQHEPLVKDAPHRVRDTDDPPRRTGKE